MHTDLDDGCSQSHIPHTAPSKRNSFNVINLVSCIARVNADQEIVDVKRQLAMEKKDSLGLLQILIACKILTEILA